MRAAWMTLAIVVGCGTTSHDAPPSQDAGSASIDGAASGDDAALAGDVGSTSDASPIADASGDALAAGDGAAPARWIPAKDTTFFWNLQSAPPDNGKDVGAYDVDGFGNDANEVAALHALNKKVVCYMDAGTYEPNRPDSAQFPAALLGSDVQGWPGEKWLDVRPAGPHYAELQAILGARFALCAQKGFDAVEPDNLDSYQNSPGFPTTAADQLAFDRWIATTVHGLGMAVFQKNDLDQIPDLVGDFDGVLDEECNKFSECAKLAPYVQANKPAWNAEYTDDGETTAAFCSADGSAGIVGALYSLALDGTTFEPCPNDVGVIH